jgi:hypothetical protein
MFIFFLLLLLHFKVGGSCFLFESHDLLELIAGHVYGSSDVGGLLKNLIVKLLAFLD